MSKRQWIMLLGVWVIAYQFLGFPAWWIKVIGVVTGLLICLVAYKLNRDVSIDEERVSYVEHKGDDITNSNSTEN